MLRFIVAVCVFVFGVSVLNQLSAQIDQPVTAKDLEGEWVADGYQCDGPAPTQRMVVKTIGSRIIMTKTRGDRCVPSGHRTFEGSLVGNQINGVVYVSNGPNQRPIRTISASLTVVSKNELTSSFGASYKRGRDAEAEPIPDELGKIEVTVRHKRTKDPVVWERLRVVRTDNSQEVGSAYLGLSSKGFAAFEALQPGQYRVFLVGDKYVKDSQEAIVTVEAGKTAKVTLNLDFTSVKVRGSIEAFKTGNKRAALKDAEVKVLFSDGHEETAHTSERGMFQVEYDKAPDFFVFEITLKSKGGELAVVSRRGFGGGPVILRTKRLDIDEPVMMKRVRFDANEKRLSTSLTPDRKLAVEHGGAFYVNIHDAMVFARDTLKLRMDHKLPVESELWNTRATGAFYSSGPAEIKIAATGTHSLRTSGNSPDNREYHEFGHHVHTDAAMSGENRLPPRPAGNANHGGIDNLSSSDSYVEGFAEFYALWINGSSVYRWGNNTRSDLENNLQDFRRVKKDASGNPVRNAQNGLVFETVMREEFQVAALLWDILDSAADAGDNIDLTDQQMWAVINRVQVFDVQTLYKELKGPLGRQKTDSNAALGDVDALFVAHRFFSDTNGNRQYDAGETIGVADFYHTRGSNLIRQQIPAPENSDLEIILPEAGDDPVFVFMELRYPDGRLVDFGTSELRDGRLSLDIPQNAESLIIEPILPGYEVEPIEISPEAFITAYEAAVIADSDIALRVEPDVTVISIEPATSPELGRDQDGLWMNWTGPQGMSFILAEGAARSPLIPADGEVLYTGSDPFFLINTIEDYEAVRFFSVFVTDGVGVSVPLMFTWPTELTDDDDGLPWWLLLIIGLLLAATMFWFFVFGRRRKDEEKDVVSGE